MKKIIGCFLVLVALIAQPINGETKEFYPKIFADIFKETHKSVVFIIGGVDLFAEVPIAVMSGTGFFVESGLIMTANHIIAGTAGELIKSGISASPEFIARLTTGESFKVVAVKQDTRLDIAVLKVEGNIERMPPPLKLGDSSKVEVGDIAVVIGHPRGFGWSVTVGIISSLRQSNAPPVGEFLQTDAAINPGNSGGPLLNLEGEVVGVITLLFQEANGIAFAVSINTAKEVLAKAQAQKKE